MSYVPFLKSLPEAFHSSTNLAILASLGIHGLLWVVLPAVPFSSQSVGSGSQRTVELIQLTPDELSRLPRASTPPVQLPAFATQPSTLPPLPPPPDLKSLQQIPSGTTNYKDFLNIPFQPQFQTVAPLPYQNKAVPSKPNNPIPFKFDQQLPPPPVAFRFDNQLPPPPPSLLTQPPTPPPAWKQPINRQLPSLAVKPQPLPDFVRNSPLPPPNTPVEGSNTPTTPSETASNNPAANSPVDIPKSKIPQRAIDELLARRSQLREPSSPGNSSGSTEVAALDNLTKWLADLKPTGRLYKKRLFPPYPPQACPGRLEGTAAVVVSVNSQGNINSGPGIIKTTGHDILEQGAVAAVRGDVKPRSGEGERQPRAYEVVYRYNPANCATPQPTPANRNSTTPQPTPANRNSTTPQPTPANRNPTTPQPTPENRSPLRSILEENDSATPQPTPTERSATPQPTLENSNTATPQPTP